AVSHPMEIEILQNIQGLKEGRPLAGEAVLVNRVSAVGSVSGLFDACKVVGEVTFIERCIVLPEEGNHFAGDIAFVETIAGGYDASGPACAFPLAFGFYQAVQRARQSREFDCVAGTVRGPIWLVPKRFVGRPLFD